MKKALLLAEKPDLMRKIEEVYDKHEGELDYSIHFESQRGHLLTLKSPSEMDEALGQWTWETLPIVPEELGGWQYKVIQEKKTGSFMTARERYEAIKKEINSGKYDFIIHAGDPDQEGELLIRIVLKDIGTRLPVKRFWTNDLTEAHILNALKNLKDDDNDPMLTNLLSAAYARQHSDWRYGMNISRAASLKMNGVVSCGRVKTPILSIVCKREDEIRNFKPKTVYGVKAKYAEGFDGALFDTQNISADENATADQKEGLVWFETKKEAEDLIRALPNKAQVVQFTTKRMETYAPKLYKLATLQIDAGKKGYNDADTLATIQKLYEQEYLSYPRTDCEYLASGEDFAGILHAVSHISEVSSYASGITQSAIEKTRTSKRWINDKALQESGHSALRPTTKYPDMSKLSEMEKDIYLMVVKRFVAIFMPPLVQDKTVLITSAGGKTFRSNGKTLVSKGFTEMLETSFSDVVIPVHQKGDVMAVNGYEIAEKTSVCPKRYTSPDLIAVCENPLKFLSDEELKKLGKKLKIGTPATRSAIIRQLIDKDKYLQEKKEKKTVYIVPTPKGELINKNLDGLMICRVDMTGLWEEQLEMIRSGEKTLAALEKEMRENVVEMIAEIKKKDMQSISERGNRKEAGTCPKCGRPVIESDKGFYCSGFKSGCRTAIFKEAFGLTFDFADYETAAKGEKIIKSGRTFVYDEALGGLKEEGAATDIPCPVCGKMLEETPDAYRCSCGFRVKKVVASHVLTKAELEDIGKMGESGWISDFVSPKSGKNFTAKLVLNKDKKLDFAFEVPDFEETDIKCPLCKKKNLRSMEKYYSCECGFRLYKVIAGHKVTNNDIEQLRTNKETDEIDDFVSQKGNNFPARLKLDRAEKGVSLKFNRVTKKK